MQNSSSQLRQTQVDEKCEESPHVHAILASCKSGKCNVAWKLCIMVQVFR